ncbi:MAG: ATP-binding cassette domain-containing protein [Rhodocyclaceae bacterium]|nr:ATP-binding cassette domain-containing protein [Rhodocyclaceae bacterium]
MTTLTLSGVAHAYALKTVLEAIDLSLDAGRILAIVGPSGCGKTTLLHLAAGLLACQTGTLANSFVRPAVMFQTPRLLPWKTTRDNIALGLRAIGLPRAEWQMRAQAMGHAVGLDAAALDRFPHQLSGGMQSRAALARALVLEPDLLLLDEPFSALDIGLKAQLHRLLLDHQAARQVAVLMITHDLMEAVRLADTILVMAPAPGRIAYRFELSVAALLRDDGFVHRTTAQLLQAGVVRECFGLESLAPPAADGDCPKVGAGGTAQVFDISRPAGKKGFAC